MKLKTRQSGFSLVELMVGMTIGLVLVAAVGQIFVSSKQTYRVQEQVSTVYESGRFGLQLMESAVRAAGYRGDPYASSPQQTFPPTAPAILGLEGASGAPDEITIRYAGSGAAGVPDMTMRDCQNAAIDSTQIAALRFFVANGANGQPALFCDSVPATATPVELIQNVDDLQILYDVITAGTSVGTVDASALTAGMNPDNIVAAHICLRVRSENAGIAIQPQPYLPCNGGPQVTPADNSLRRVFRTTVTVRNRIN